MKIFLNEKELEILKKAYKEENTEIVFPRKETINNRIYLEADEDTFIILREVCSEYLLKVGFDSNYKANKEGIILEQLIDKFYFG